MIEHNYDRNYWDIYYLISEAQTKRIDDEEFFWEMEHIREKLENIDREYNKVYNRRYKVYCQNEIQEKVIDLILNEITVDKQQKEELKSKYYGIAMGVLKREQEENESL